MRILKSSLSNICCVIIICLLVSQAHGQYCSASGGCNEYIYAVQVGTINNTAAICNNYADYTSSHSTLMEIGTGYPITVVTAVGPVPYVGYEGDQCGIWVDWNQDGDFDDLNETVYTASGCCLFTTTITPLSEALAGDTRMRVRLMRLGTLSPCGSTTYGEVEDYTIAVGGFYGGGTGAPETPFLIYTAEQMNEIGANPDHWDKHFKLMADIDLGEYTGDSFNIIGDHVTKFTGVFDGNGHKIYNFTYTAELHFIGLFRYVDGPTTEIKNLGLINPNVTAVGSSRWVTGALTGLLGPLNKSKISNCYVIGGNISGGYDVGGLVGESYEGEIVECYTKCQVSGSQDNIGGLVGSASSYSSITNCYSMSNSTGDFSVGGLVGDNSGAIINCYATGSVTGSYWVSGLTGETGDGIISSFWDTEISRINYGDGGEQKTTEEMKTKATYISAGWDFVGESANGTDDIWDICEGMNYPKFAWQISLPGDFVCPDGVDFIDFAVFGSAWMSEPDKGNWDPECDISDPNDDIINFSDMAVFTENWLADIK